jgi:hypothetical protein
LDDAPGVHGSQTYRSRRGRWAVESLWTGAGRRRLEPGFARLDKERARLNRRSEHLRIRALVSIGERASVGPRTSAGPPRVCTVSARCSPTACDVVLTISAVIPVLPVKRRDVPAFVHIGAATAHRAEGTSRRASDRAKPITGCPPTGATDIPRGGAGWFPCPADGRASRIEFRRERSSIVFERATFRDDQRADATPRSRVLPA